MRCHTCPHSEAILCGEYDSTPWNELPCAACKLGEDTFYSVPLDEEHPPENLADDSGIPTHGGVPEGRGGSSLLPAAILSQFVQGLLSLPSELRDIVAWRYQGLPYKEIAKRQGISTQLAEMRHKRAMREWPALESLFPYKVAKRRRRLSKK